MVQMYILYSTPARDATMSFLRSVPVAVQGEGNAGHWDSLIGSRMNAVEIHSIYTADCFPARRSNRMPSLVPGFYTDDIFQITPLRKGDRVGEILRLTRQTDNPQIAARLECAAPQLLEEVGKIQFLVVG